MGQLFYSRTIDPFSFNLQNVLNMKRYFIIIIFLLVNLNLLAQLGYYQYHSEGTGKVDALFQTEELSPDTLLLFSVFTYMEDSGLQLLGLAFRKVSPGGEVYQQSRIKLKATTIRAQYLIASKDTSYFMVISDTRVFYDSLQRQWKDYIGVYKIGRYDLRLHGYDTLYIPHMTFHDHTGHLVNDSTFVGLVRNPLKSNNNPFYDDIVFTFNNAPKILHHNVFPNRRIDFSLVDIIPSPIHDGYLGWGGYSPVLLDKHLNWMRYGKEIIDVRVACGDGHIIRLPSGKYISVGGLWFDDPYSRREVDNLIMYRLSSDMVVEKSKIIFPIEGSGFHSTSGRGIDAVYDNVICLSTLSKEFVQLDNDLNKIWTYKAGYFLDVEHGLSTITDVKALRDSSCLYSGMVRYQDHSGQDAFFIRINKKGQITSSFDQPLSLEGVRIFPNPASSSLLNVDLGDVPAGDKYRIKLFSIEGQMVFSARVIKGENQFELGLMPSGTYTYTILDNNGAIVKEGKWIRF